MIGVLRHAWDRLSIYLPVLLMGLLALGTWWLVKNTPGPIAAARTRLPDEGFLGQELRWRRPPAQ